MDRKTEEWLKQVDYDIDTAQSNFITGRYIYCAFMCHLSIEKALKALYNEKLKQIPPKVHNLIYLINQINISISEDFRKFLVRLNEANIFTRYPDDIEKLKSKYTESITLDILNKSKDIIVWIKQQL